MYFYTIDKLIDLLGKHGYNPHNNPFLHTMLTTIPAFRRALDWEMYERDVCEEWNEKYEATSDDDCPF